MPLIQLLLIFFWKLIIQRDWLKSQCGPLKAVLTVLSSLTFDASYVKVEIVCYTNGLIVSRYYDTTLRVLKDD